LNIKYSIANATFIGLTWILDIYTTLKVNIGDPKSTRL